MDVLANIYWLVGLLEGEGTFMGPSPSRPNDARIEIEMKDRDVIDRVGALLGVHASTRRRMRPRGADSVIELHITYRARINGVRAVQLMRTLLPHLSARRQVQIRRALATFTPRTAKQAAASRRPFPFPKLCANTMCANPPVFDLWCADCVRYTSVSPAA